MQMADWKENCNEKSMDSSESCKKEVKNMSKLLISGGHGGSDPGACGNGLNERDYCSEFIDRVRWVLDNCFNYRSPFKHIKVPNGSDANSDVNGAVTFVNNNYLSGENTLAIDYHLNASSNQKARGWEILCHTNSKSNEMANRLAKLLQPVYSKLEMPFRGVKCGNDFGFIGRTKPTAFIFELAFVTNPYEAKTLKGKDSSESLVYSHARALLNTLGVQYEIKTGSKEML